MILSAIAAMSSNRIIGYKDSLPWHLPEDLQYFKTKTTGKVMIMGRKTFESIGKPLPGRYHIIITRDKNFKYDHELVSVVHDCKAAIEKARAMTATYGPEVFNVGGGQIYKDLLPFTDRIYLTEIEKDYEGDTSFPTFTEKEFKLVSKDRHVSTVAFSFCVYERVK